MSRKNIFGGGNPNSLYVPMSEVEQEVISRLVEAKDLRVHIVGWGVVNNPRVIFGDLRLSLIFRVNFDRPPPPGIPVHFFDLELRTGSGLLLFKDRKSIEYNGKPAMAAAGVYFDLVWDIAINAIDPKVVKALKPGATGLTSRRQDRDTGLLTVEGNMQLDANQRKALDTLHKGEAAAKAHDAQKLAAAEKRSKGK